MPFHYDTKAGTEVPALFVETDATGALTSLHHDLFLPPDCQPFGNNSSHFSGIGRRVNDHLKSKLFEPIHQSNENIASEKLFFGRPGKATKPLPTFRGNRFDDVEIERSSNLDVVSSFSRIVQSKTHRVLSHHKCRIFQNHIRDRT